jgi:hypothetical protein
MFIGCGVHDLAAAVSAAAVPGWRHGNPWTFSP